MGADGAGKSTVSRLATERLCAGGTRVERVDRWDIIDNAAYPATLFMRPDVLNTRLCVAEMPSTSRFLFLMWSITQALLGRTPEAARPDKVTLLDGYWMKHAAGEIVYGLDRSWVEGVVCGLPLSEQVIYLRVDPKWAWERKAGRDLVPYECGMDPECSQDSFLTHQSRILGVLDDWAEQFGWLTVDAGEPLDEVVGRVVSAVSGLSTPDER
ncbi:thymidylate kinase [Streptomyces sp. NPDC059883]|uniref:thymidylate kinase n=1 Tax=unclassified Streptomyces TaxID=2593676 RepID=UPI00365F5065